MKNTIEVIRPIRVDESNEFLIERIGNFNYDHNIPKNISFTVVDEGSSAYYLQKIKDECNKYSVKLITLDRVNELFCPGRARNFGAMYSNAEYIFFQDLDLLPYDGFYNDLTDQIEIANIANDPDQFVMIPCIYLTEEGNKLYDGTSYSKKFFIRANFGNVKSLVERYSTGTSACLYNRIRFLQLGGFDREYIAWGYEDLDLNCRFIRKSRLFPLSKNWASDKYNFNSVIEYEGWKSVYRLFGDINFFQGITLFHAHHPIHKSRTDFKEIVEKNRRHFNDNLKKNLKIKALPDKNKGKSLIFKPCAFNINNEFLPFVGDAIFFKDLQIDNADRVIEFIKTENISQVIFQNPYSDKLTEDVFNLCRFNNIKFVICERGALPESCFYDDSGFLANSKYYDPIYWDKPITPLNDLEVEKYSQSVLRSEYSLEKQGKIASRLDVKKKYNCIEKKIVFVPLQRPDDTAVKKFERKNSYSDYLKLIEQLSNEVSEYCILVKKHPLEDVIEGLEQNDKLKFVDSDENINSLISACDIVLTFTSGSGLLGLLGKKRVITVGNSFYSHPGLATNADNIDDILKILKTKPNLSKEEEKKINRFIHYLTNEYYSFGEFKTREVKFENGKRITATTDINLYQLICYGKKYTYPKKDRVLIDFSSGLFDRYRHAQQTASLNSRTQATTASREIPKINNKAQNQLVDAQLQIEPKLTLRERRLKKLKENPYRYFSESNWAILRLFAPIFKK